MVAAPVPSSAPHQGEGESLDPRTPCRHCGLPLGRYWKEEYGPFCCNGCRAVYSLIHDEGLERYYDLRPGGEAPPPKLRPDSYAWLAPLLAEALPADRTRLARLTLDLQGVHCAACIWLLEELWRRRKGAIDLRINPTLGRAEFAWIPAELDLEEYLRAAEGFGYRFGPRRKGELHRSRGLVVRLGICTAASLNAMMFSLCFYFGLAPSDGALYLFFGQLNLWIALIAVAVGGSVFFKAAWMGLRRRMVHLDLPIALGIALGFGGSAYAYLTRGPQGAYFDTITIFVTLMLVGRWLQERVLERNRLSLLASDGVDNLFTRRLAGEQLETIRAAEVRPGDELWILPGDLVPVEGALLGASADLSLDWISGESQVRSFEPGETIPAGAFNAGSSALRLGAREGFAASRLQSLLVASPGCELDAGGARRGHQRWWGRVATIYVALVLALALVGFALWLPAGLEQAIEVAVAILVVTCPCALGLATPLANELVHIALRRRGIFVRSPDYLQRALHLRRILFDKTGTLTPGDLVLSARARAALDALDEGEKEVLGNLSARSLHPASRCVFAALGAGSARVIRDLAVTELAGRGLEASYGGHHWRFGRKDFATGGGDSSARSTCFSVDGRQRLLLSFEEQLKSDARDEVQILQREGYEIYLLSGDTPERVRRAAQSLGIPPEHSQGGLSPEAKAERVRALDRNDTLMIGDGLNDGPSFDAAACCATPAVDRPHLPGRADFYFLGEGISAVRTTLRLARRLHAVVKANLCFAVLYNLLAVGLCLAGLVSPVIAAILMPASSVSLVAITVYRLSGRRLGWTS